ncbi:helix-turn-helix transcriptional regulator [Bacillus haynesii]|uniref:helix-turn-helix domain-containing protein n=1 Tax=Bacillus haynesii TaxID=1925021 RepID=UPI0022819540|nr:helix-turn-helix transcriptional regulator [Bacillus haynesii]MCY9226024.1 helix-turn-helix transcriptional regulator [Bacillus haynesii]
MIRSNLKAIADEAGISISRLSAEINHGKETVRKMYNDDMERFPRELLDKLCKHFNCEPGDLIKFENDE